MTEPARQSGCALCWIDGVWSKPIDKWPGFPICREHLAESLERTSGQPVIRPWPGFATAHLALQ
jgi:hypothetical protein